VLSLNGSACDRTIADLRGAGQTIFYLFSESLKTAGRFFRSRQGFEVPGIGRTAGQETGTGQGFEVPVSWLARPVRRTFSVFLKTAGRFLISRQGAEVPEIGGMPVTVRPFFRMRN
jgi:hypothetical protein